MLKSPWKSSVIISESENAKGERGYSVLAFEGEKCVADEFFYMAEMAEAFSEKWMSVAWPEWNNIVSWSKN